MEIRVVGWPDERSGKYFLCEYREGRGYFPFAQCKKPSDNPCWDGSIPFWRI